MSAVEEYTSNGVWDLSLLGVWSVVQDQTGEGEALPLWYFGRDDRMLKYAQMFTLSIPLVNEGTDRGRSICA